MLATYPREAAAGMAVFAFFAAAWFGWAQDAPPEAWRRPLAIASVLSIVVAAIGGVLTWQRWDDPSVFDLDGAGTGWAFGVVVGIEVALAGAGAAVLSRTHRGEFIPAWIALVVGVHFVPLAPLLEFPLLYVAAVAVVGVAMLAVPMARSRRSSVSAVAGAGTGLVLLLLALTTLVGLA